MKRTTLEPRGRVDRPESAETPPESLFAGPARLRAMTAEEHAAAGRKAQAALAARRAAGRARYRTDFYQNRQWEAAAARLGVRLPQWHEEPTPAAIRRWCRRLNVPMARYHAWIGGTDLSEFARYNPTFPLRYLIGCMVWEIAESGALGAEGGKP